MMSASTTMTLTTTHYRGTAAFDALADRWDALAHATPNSSPFQSLAYQRAWWSNLGPGELHTIAVHNGDDLVAIAPFYLLDGVLYFNGCTEETDYLDIIALPDTVDAAWDAVFACLCQADFADWQALDLCNVPDASPSRVILERIAATRGFSFADAVQEVCPVIQLPQTFDDYLEQLDKKQRHEVRRKLRRAEGADVRYVVADDPATLAADVDEFLDLLQKSTPEKAAWLNAPRRAVFHTVAAAGLADGTLQLLFAEVDGQRAAALFNLDYKNRIWVYNSGLDPAAFGYLSLGVVLTAHAIDRAIGAGRAEFDFMRGNEEYKYRFGARDTTVHRVYIGKSN